MGLLIAGTGHPNVIEWAALNSSRIYRRRKEFFIVSRDFTAFLETIDVTPRIFTPFEATWISYRRKRRRAYLVSRENSLSFPTPKLGAKTRRC